jgi:hypothetical protein
MEGQQPKKSKLSGYKETKKTDKEYRNKND